MSQGRRRAPRCCLSWSTEDAVLPTAEKVNNFKLFLVGNYRLPKMGSSLSMSEMSLLQVGAELGRRTFPSKLACEGKEKRGIR